MATLSVLDAYMTPLLAGNRVDCREFVEQQVSRVGDANVIYRELLWPAMERVEKLFRSDRINTAAEHMATRINRFLADQLQTRLPKADRKGRQIVIMCADDEPEELGAQMTADLLESKGWTVYFLGGGVPNDEILTLVGQLRPDILLVFGTQPAGVPGVRRLVDMVREISPHPTMNVMVSGGVFDRADGLWKEVDADLHAKTAHEVLALAEAAEPRKIEPRPQGEPKKRRRRRRPPLLPTNESK